MSIENQQPFTSFPDTGNWNGYAENANMGGELTPAMLLGESEADDTVSINSWLSMHLDVIAILEVVPKLNGDNK